MRAGWLDQDSGPAVDRIQRLAQNKGQHSIFSAVGTRLGVSCIARTAITGPTIPCPSSRRTTTHSTNTRPGSKRFVSVEFHRQTIFSLNDCIALKSSV
jgi:hypothetical protein